MARWLLVRHGETEWNKAGKIQGHTDIPISAAGRVQVGALRERLRAATFDAVYTSDLVRCTDTAALILQGRTVTPELAPELRELDYGDWEGKTMAQVQESWAEAHDEYRRLDPNFKAPGGESFFDLMSRVGAWTDRVRASAGDGTILIVAHGGSVRMMALHLMGLDWSAFRRLAAPGPASVAAFGLYGAEPQLEAWNDCGHYRPLT